MSLSERARRRILFCSVIVVMLTLSVVMSHMLIEIITEAYNQIVTDFGNPE